MTVPLAGAVASGTMSKVIGISFPEDVLKALDKRVDETGVPRSRILQSFVLWDQKQNVWPRSKRLLVGRRGK